MTDKDTLKEIIDSINSAEGVSQSDHVRLERLLGWARADELQRVLRVQVSHPELYASALAIYADGRAVELEGQYKGTIPGEEAI